MYKLADATAGMVCRDAKQPRVGFGDAVVLREHREGESAVQAAAVRVAVAVGQQPDRVAAVKPVEALDHVIEQLDVLEPVPQVQLVELVSGLDLGPLDLLEGRGERFATDVFEPRSVMVVACSHYVADGDHLVDGQPDRVRSWPPATQLIEHDTKGTAHDRVEVPQGAVGIERDRPDRHEAHLSCRSG